MPSTLESFVSDIIPIYFLRRVDYFHHRYIILSECLYVSRIS